MPDIVDLLNSAVPDISSESDLGALARRADVLRRRQQALRALPALAVVLAVSLVALSHSPGEPDRLAPVPATGGSISASPRPLTATLGPPAGSRPTPQATGTPQVSTGTAPVARPAASPSASAASSSTSRPAPSPTSYPAADACEVDTTGLEVGQSRSCDFTATAAGGWRERQVGEVSIVVDNNYRVDVTRKGKTSSYGPFPGNRESCGNDVVEPGDLVRITVTWDRNNQHVGDFKVAAGAGYDCFSAS